MAAHAASAAAAACSGRADHQLRSEGTQERGATRAPGAGGWVGGWFSLRLPWAGGWVGRGFSLRPPPQRRRPVGMSMGHARLSGMSVGWQLLPAVPPLVPPTDTAPPCVHSRRAPDRAQRADHMPLIVRPLKTRPRRRPTLPYTGPRHAADLVLALWSGSAAAARAASSRSSAAALQRTHAGLRPTTGKNLRRGRGRPVKNKDTLPRAEVNPLASR